LESPIQEVDILQQDQQRAMMVRGRSTHPAKRSCRNWACSAWRTLLREDLATAFYCLQSGPHEDRSEAVQWCIVGGQGTVGVSWNSGGSH